VPVNFPGANPGIGHRDGASVFAAVPSHGTQHSGSYKRRADSKEILLKATSSASGTRIPSLLLDSQSEDILASILDHIEPCQAASIRALLLDAVADAWGQHPDPAAMHRFLLDIRIAQDLPATDLDYAEHCSRMHETGVDFMDLVQIVKAAGRHTDPEGGSLFFALFQSVFS